MHHPVFGEIVYQGDDACWVGRCRLPAFAEYGRAAEGGLDEPDADFLAGFFPLTVYDDSGNGPSPEQESAFRYLVGNEAAVCRAVMTELLSCYRSLYGANWDWARRHERSWLVGWLARSLLRGERRTVDDLRPVVRCTGVEVSAGSVGGYASLGFGFDSADSLDPEHGIAVVFHPDRGTFWGDATAVHDPPG